MLPPRVNNEYHDPTIPFTMLYHITSEFFCKLKVQAQKDEKNEKDEMAK